MVVFSKCITFETHRRMQFFDVTFHVAEAVRESAVKDGIAVIFSCHSTCAVRVNEWEDGLLFDLEEFLSQLTAKQGKYKHDLQASDGRVNAHSHLKSLLLGSSVSIPIVAGRLDIGRWQSVMFIELDGPRSERRMRIQILGE